MMNITIFSNFFSLSPLSLLSLVDLYRIMTQLWVENANANKIRKTSKNTPRIFATCSGCGFSYGLQSSICLCVFFSNIMSIYYLCTYISINVCTVCSCDGRRKSNVPLTGCTCWSLQMPGNLPEICLQWVVFYSILQSFFIASDFCFLFFQSNL